MTSWPYVSGPSPGGLSVPPGAIMLIKDGIDIIGLSISDKPLVSLLLWDIFYIIIGSVGTMRPSADIIDRIKKAHT